VLGLLIVGIVIGGGWWLWNRRRSSVDASPEVLRTAEVVRDDLELVVAASGNVAVEQELDLAFELPGQVEVVLVEEGDRVERGQELARLDQASLLDAVRQAELELANAELSLAAAQDPPEQEDLALAERARQEALQAMSVAKASEELALARQAADTARAKDLEEKTREAYERYLDLLDDFGQPEAFAAGITAAYMEAQGSVGITELRTDYAVQQARSQWLSAYQRYQQASYNLEQLKAGPADEQIEQLRLQVASAELSLERAQAATTKAALVAPIDGVVARVNLEAGLAAPVGLPAVTLLNDDELFVELTVDEIDIGALASGQTVEVTVDAFPETVVKGVIDRIGLLSESLGGVVAYPVWVRLSNPESVDIREGMTASARVTTGVREQVLLVPNWAVRTDQTSGQVYTYCYCVQDGVPKPVQVEMGLSNDTWSEVLTGLDEGATVALVIEAVNLFELQGPPSRGTP
jgi:RND family efflux transporter MFP subunit